MAIFIYLENYELLRLFELLPLKFNEKNQIYKHCF
jgi:hypothetical protein